MIAYSLAVLAGVVLDAWILALVALRGRRPWLQATFAAVALTFVVNGAAFVGTSEGLLGPAWDAAVLWTLVLAYPLTTILVLSLIHGETLPRRRAAAFALLALAPLVVLLTPSADWGVSHAYAPNLLGAFLILCLGLALAEAVYRRMTSALFGAEAFWLVAGVAVLIIGGPIYALEFQDLGLLQSAGSNVAAPAALALFALVLLHADPFAGAHPRPAHRWTGTSVPPARTAIVFDEARPKYALDSAARASARGQPVLVLGRATPEPRASGVALVPTRHAALKLLSTVSEFGARAPGGLAVLPDLGDVATMSGWARTHEAVLRLRGVAEGTGTALVFSASGLTGAEKADLRADGLTWWSLPDPADEFEAVLTPSFGPGSRRLLEAFARSEALRRRDLTLHHADAFLRFLERALAELSTTAADDAARTGLRTQTEAASAALRAFVARDAADLARGGWPSRQAAAADRGLLVTAAEYWKGKEMEELLRTATDLGDRESLFERAREVFVQQLGDAGEGMLRSELAKLGRRPEDLRPEDVSRLADRAAVDLAALADVVDVPQERVRIRDQIESIRRRLAAIAGDER